MLGTYSALKRGAWVGFGATVGILVGYNEPKDCEPIPIVEWICTVTETSSSVVTKGAVGAGVGFALSFVPLTVALGAGSIAIAIVPLLIGLDTPSTESTGGTKPQFVIPAQGTLSQGYHPAHFGIDIANAVGTPVVASHDGTVVFAGWDDWGLGNMVKIQTADKEMVTVYGHNSKLEVSYGEAVRQGDIIALMGSTGNSTGPHLHFEILSKGKTFDPCIAIDCKGL